MLTLSNELGLEMKKLRKKQNEEKLWLAKRKHFLPWKRELAGSCPGSCQNDNACFIPRFLQIRQIGSFGIEEALLTLELRVSGFEPRQLQDGGTLPASLQDK